MFLSWERWRENGGDLGTGPRGGERGCRLGGERGWGGAEEGPARAVKERRVLLFDVPSKL